MIEAGSKQRRAEAIGQLVRFGAVGVGVTLLSVAIYWPIATYGDRILNLGRGAAWPEIGGLISFIAGVLAGNYAHSRISFRGHGSRDKRTLHRFLAVQLLALALNQTFIWILTGPLFHGPTWWPLVPIILVTPLITFGIQRNWVYA